MNNVEILNKIKTVSELENDFREHVNNHSGGEGGYLHPSTHPASMITGLSAVGTSGRYNDLIGIPSSFTPSSHNHEQYDNELDDILLRLKAIEEGQVISVTGVNISLSSKSLTVGENFTLIATVQPSTATNKNVVWSSNNTNIVDVNSGLVTAKAIGSAMITVRTVDGNFTATCNITVTNEAGVGLEDLTMARIDFTGDITGMTEEVKKVVDMTIMRKDGTTYLSKKASLKWQGSSSLLFDKKNYSMTLLEADGSTKYSHKFFADVDEASGYHLKANYADYTMCRNVISAKAIKDCYNVQLPNNPRGIIDGFPVVVYVNGEKYGVYTWNLKQDPTVYKQDKTNANHIMYRGTPSALTCQFRALSVDNSDGAEDWEDKFPETNSETNRAKLNRLIQWVMDADDTEFKDNVEQYLNKEYLLKYIAICEYGAFTDSLANNVNLVTYDGSIWYLTFYDMDACWGSGAGELIDIEYNRTFESMPSSGSLLLSKARRVFKTEINDYIKQFSTEELSPTRIFNLMSEFVNVVGATEYQYDCIRWNKNTSYGIYGMMPPAETKVWMENRIEFLTGTVEENTITLGNTSYAAVKGDDLIISAAINIKESSPSYEIFKDGEYFTQAYKTADNEITIYTTYINTGTYTGLTIRAKVWVSGVLTYVAESQEFSMIINASGGGGTTTPVTSVSLNETTKTVNVNDSFSLLATVSPSDATNKNVTWSTSNASVATVTNGNVSAIAKGTAIITVTTEDGGKTATCNLTVEEAGTVDTIVLNKTDFTVEKGVDLIIGANININTVSTLIFEVRKDGAYFTNAYRTATNELTIYTNQINAATYSNLTIVAKTYTSSLTTPISYTDLAESQQFSMTITNATGGTVAVTSVSVSPTSKTLTLGEGYSLTATISPYNATDKSVTWSSSNTSVATVSSDGYVSTYSAGTCIITCTTSYGSYKSTCSVTVEEPPVGDEYSTLKLMYPMPQAHGAIPSGAPTDWKNYSRWENQTKPSGWNAFVGWAQVYRVDGTAFSQNTGVEIKDYKVYGWKDGQWNLATKFAIPYGAFYAEDFTDDANNTFPGNRVTSSTGDSVVIRLTSDMTLSTSAGTKNVCYHPYTSQMTYDDSFEYVYTCVSMRKIKWDSSGVDDLATSRYCASCGGDWWRYVGATWLPDWSNNRGIAQPKIMEVTTDWNVFSMSTVPEDWTNGFPT